MGKKSIIVFIFISVSINRTWTKTKPTFSNTFSNTPRKFHVSILKIGADGKKTISNYKNYKYVCFGVVTIWCRAITIILAKREKVFYSHYAYQQL